MDWRGGQITRKPCELLPGNQTWPRHHLPARMALRSNNWAFDTFLETPDNDGKVDVRTFSTFIWNYPGAVIYQETFSEAYATNLDFIGGRKYLDFETPDKPQSDFGFAGFPSAINWRSIRFADVLLMYAEAENEANGPSATVLDALESGSPAS